MYSAPVDGLEDRRDDRREGNVVVVVLTDEIHELKGMHRRSEHDMWLLAMLRLDEGSMAIVYHVLAVRINLHSSTVVFSATLGV